MFSNIFLKLRFTISRLWKENSGKTCFQTYSRKEAIKIQRIDQSRKFKKWVSIFSQGIPLPNFSSETLHSSSKSRGQAGSLGGSTGGSRGSDGLRNKNGSKFWPNKDVYQVSSQNINIKYISQIPWPKTLAVATFGHGWFGTIFCV